jgi:hypothetical protein
MVEVEKLNHGSIVEIPPTERAVYVAKEPMSGALKGFEQFKVISISEPTVVQPQIEKPVFRTEELKLRPSWQLTPEEKKALVEKGGVIFEKLKELGKFTKEELEKLFKKEPEREKYIKMMKEIGVEVL